MLVRPKTCHPSWDLFWLIVSRAAASIPVAWNEVRRRRTYHRHDCLNLSWRWYHETFERSMLPLKHADNHFRDPFRLNLRSAHTPSISLFFSVWALSQTWCVGHRRCSPMHLGTYYDAFIFLGISGMWKWSLLLIVIYRFQMHDLTLSTMVDNDEGTVLGCVPSPFRGGVRGAMDRFRSMWRTRQVVVGFTPIFCHN
ncbi:hypothetical protein FA15DRAFT_445456 [Coprinopsis marcescibilis]|uniref:Uncharacterized protein n=1 Tax=Coprinopsis marcescibilis TaxID=230819 RepID=A0A5C3KU03_COPMA|nr:hypothetical protein FA15DRAFT_445456 [Coprinopsis marcescibilis]